MSMVKATSAFKLEGLHTDVYHMYTEHLPRQKQTLKYLHILCSDVSSKIFIALLPVVG